ncbi:adenylate kinase 9-like [Trichoplusia ni]|uniref:Adenylate kinase 9-like n=1 Tax=Trichoplusia ni TaxID=7111 RepID=A0A7E5WPA6_TRINI|nr:adenylate kinase 9-like [Trichoplusia ni]
MIEFENYKSNVVVRDKYDFKDVPVSKGTVFCGATERIFEKQEEVERTSPLLAAAVIGLDNTAIPIPKKSKFINVWTDHDAQEIFLDTKPTCYVIFGKSGAGAFKIGEALSKRLNCIHLCPKHIISDELEQRSQTGRTLDFNLKRNIPCNFDVMLKILKTKVQSPSVQHRGYVISGIPLVPSSKDKLCFIKALFSEEGFLIVEDLLFDIICNIKKKKPTKSVSSPNASESSQLSGEDEKEDVEEEHHAEEEAVEEEEAAPAALPKFILDFCSNVIEHKKGYYKTTQATLLTQIEEIFKLSLAPDVIIHASCPDLDIVTIKKHKYLNYKTGQSEMKPFEFTYVSDIRRPPKFVISDFDFPDPPPTIFNPKYNCLVPGHFKERCLNQICNYQNMVFPFMDKKIKDFNPRRFIEIDGRTNLKKMLHNVMERLTLLHIQPVLVPEPLYLQESAEDIEEFWKSVSSFNTINSGVLNFKRTPSHWYNRCPVELKLRRSVVGNPKYAMALFKHVYVMSSLDNFISFYKNPRPYLKLKYLEPTCRVIIVGTKSSGKSMIAECLSWIFDCPITNFENLLEKEKEKKYEIFARSILSEIIATIEDARHRDWQRSESDRETKLNAWSKNVLKLLNEYCEFVNSLKQKEKEKRPVKKRRTKKVAEKKELLEQGDQELLDDVKEENQLPEEEEKQVLVLEEEKEIEYTSEEEHPILDPQDQLKINALRQKLFFLPMLDNIEECEIAISDKSFLEYAPAELTTVTKKPAIPILGDEDVTIAISNYILTNELGKEIEPTSDEIMSEIVKHIYTIDENHEQETNGEELYGKYIIDGLPSDPEYWSHLNNPKLTPDHTIALIENKEVDQELMLYYTNLEKCTKYYADKILAANDPLIETKLVSEKTKPISVKDIIENLIDYSFNRAFNAIVVSENQEIPESNMTSFSESIDKFREDWDSLKLMLEEKSKSYIEVELENKTDVEIIEEVLLKLRNSYTFMPPASIDEDEKNDDDDDIDSATKDLLTYNDPKFYCETYTYSPVTFFIRDTLWKGNPSFSLLYDNKVHNFANEEFLEKFRRDKSRYMFYNKPLKVFPKIKVCLTGSIGCGATVLGKKIAKELGLLYINFADIINFYMKPRHFKNVGRKYENMFIDEPLDDDGVVEFQMGAEDENEMGDILTNETEMRRMIQFYFDRGTPLTSFLAQKMIKKIWFNPFVPTGFILDGYPRMPSDFEDMLSATCIPDIIIDLASNSDVAIKRMAPGMFTQWKNQQLEAKEKAKAKLNKEREEWNDRITQKVVIKLIFEEIFDNMFFPPGDKDKRLSVESAIMDAHPSGSSNVDPLLFNSYNELIQEYPEPIDTNEWESNNEARERIESRIQVLFETDDENIQAMKELIREQKIKMTTIDGTKPEYKVFRECLSTLMFLKHRNRSLLEQTFVVSIETANWLLQNGFCFVSKFNRICPVHIYLYPKSVQNSYKIARRKGTLYPVLHRAYIYFICKAEYVKTFRRNPLKFVTSKAIEAYCEYPLRISFIGGPKSGVSTLVAKIAKDNCLINISKGLAIRRVLERMPWTEQATKLRSQLADGELLDDDVIIDAIQTAAIDHRTVTYGFILDGMPETPYRAKALVKLGLYPNIIFDLNVNKIKAVENCLNEVNYDNLKYLPPFPKPLIEKRYENWRIRTFKIREWITDDYQNLTVINANQSKWKVFKDVDDCIFEIAEKIHFYLVHVDKGIVRAMWVSNESFSERQSSYKNLCPVCFSKKVYRHSDFPPDKKGIVQYKNTFYWVCEEHLESVMMFPHFYLAPQDIEIPEIPAVVKSIKKQFLYEKGTCIVTYAETLPAQKVVAGSLDYACRYRQKAYLFCSKECLTKFLAKPHLYYDIQVFRESKNFKKLSLKNLPHLGYLEQTIGNVLTDACCSVNVLRPKYPGLSFPLSAIIFIALWFKVNNPLMDKEKKALYHKALVVFEARCKMLTRVGLVLRSMNNPFTSYPICHHAEPTLRPVEQEELCSVTIQAPANVHKSSIYVQKHKPSFVQSDRRLHVSSSMARTHE